MANRIQLRRGSAQEWSNVNPTLAIGELGIEIDTGRIKIGDGVTTWNTLKYERPLESITNTPSTLVQRDADGSFSDHFDDYEEVVLPKSGKVSPEVLEADSSLL